jgi:hypothetical protein
MIRMRNMCYHPMNFQIRQQFLILEIPLVLVYCHISCRGSDNCAGNNSHQLSGGSSIPAGQSGVAAPMYISELEAQSQIFNPPNGNEGSNCFQAPLRGTKRMKTIDISMDALSKTFEEQDIHQLQLRIIFLSEKLAEQEQLNYCAQKVTQSVYGISTVITFGNRKLRGCI